MSEDASSRPETSSGAPGRRADGAATGLQERPRSGRRWRLPVIVLALELGVLGVMAQTCGSQSPAAEAPPTPTPAVGGFPDFKVAIAGRYFHNGPGDSTLFLCVSTDPPQASAPLSWTVTKPDSTKVSGSASLDTSGKATVSTPINQFGSYTAEGSVTRQGRTRNTTTTVSVTQQQGSRC